MAMAKRKNAMGVRLTDEAKEKLEYLASASGISQTAVIEVLIRDGFDDRKRREAQHEAQMRGFERTAE